MFCTSCGQAISNGVGNCPACGVLLRGSLLSHSNDLPSDSLITSITPPHNSETSGPFSTSAGEAQAESTITTPPKENFVGRILGGRYQLDECIGSGGMGNIYRARRLHIGDTVAVKILRPEIVDNAQSRQRFHREARAAAMLHHPNAVVIHDFGEDSDGTVYIVMELLEGRSLRQVLVESGKIAPERAYHIIRQTCAVLEAAHCGGVVHRDIKPDNIMLLNAHGSVDHVKILDFGIAKLRDKTLDTLSLEKNLTSIGAVMGTPHYMSPEQCQGESADARSDIYSLGVVAYEMLTGVIPFIARTPTGVAIKHVTEKPEPLISRCPELSQAIEKVVLRALEKDPRARQQSALELAQEFAAAIDEGPITSELKMIETQSTSTSNEAKRTAPETTSFPLTRKQQSIDTSRLNKQKFETQLSPSESAEAISLTPIAEDTSPQSSAPLKRKLPVLFIGAGVGTAILLAMTGWWIWGRMGSESVAPQSITYSSPMPVDQVSPIVSASPVTLVVPTGMVYIPGGEFTLGRDEGEADERPAHVVSVKPFFIDLTEVTNEQYQEFVRKTNYPPPPSWNGLEFPQEIGKLPVVDVTWEDAQVYARWAGKRLPTEEEWEFAARGMDGRIYPWGNAWQPEVANVSSKPGEKRDLMPVGQFPQGVSPYGVQDLSGNVWEWTASNFAAYPGGYLSPPPPGFSNLKVIRGGSFESLPKQATTTLRRGWPATRRDWPIQGQENYQPDQVDYGKTGFRCVQDVP